MLSEKGSGIKLFRLGEAGVLQPIVGLNVLQEWEQVERRKAPASLLTLVYFLELGAVEIATRSPDEFIEGAKANVAYEPDAYVLAEARSDEPDWFITHDRAHYIDVNPESSLTIYISTPGDLIHAMEDEFTQSWR